MDADSQGAARLHWTKCEDWRDWARLSEGCYLLRTNITDWTPEELWRAYHPTDGSRGRLPHPEIRSSDPPRLAPKTGTRAGPHPGLLPGLCSLENLEAQCRQAGLGDEPREIFADLSEIALVDVHLPTRNGVTVRKRCIGQPNQHQLILLQHLGLHLPAVPEFAQM